MALIYLLFLTICSIASFVGGYCWGRKNAINAFLNLFCGASVKYNRNNEIESITYYCIEDAYKEKIQELRNSNIENGETIHETKK